MCVCVCFIRAQNTPMAQQETGKRAHEDQSAGGAPSKAARYDIALNCKLSDAVDDVKDYHHADTCETLRMQLVEVRAQLAALEGALRCTPRSTRSNAAGSHFVRICDSIRNELAGVDSGVSKALDTAATLAEQQQEDVRKVLWGAFDTCSRDEQAVRLYRLLKLWTGQKYHVAPDLPGFRVEEPTSGGVVAIVTRQGELVQHGVVLLRFSTPLATWGQFKGF